MRVVIFDTARPINETGAREDTNFTRRPGLGEKISSDKCPYIEKTNKQKNKTFGSSLSPFLIYFFFLSLLLFSPSFILNKRGRQTRSLAHKIQSVSFSHNRQNSCSPFVSIAIPFFYFIFLFLNSRALRFEIILLSFFALFSFTFFFFFILQILINLSRNRLL